ncbi:hypothetical protein IWX49DRAFT_176687 [Phyllosticta citricarpa]|uniref:Uncharacterized protein n=1 Tax=Phyllosticta citricarpa TaxID=55181 RepID=A0ABR1M2F6_9PEZI
MLLSACSSRGDVPVQMNAFQASAARRRTHICLPACLPACPLSVCTYARTPQSAQQRDTSLSSGVGVGVGNVHLSCCGVFFTARSGEGSSIPASEEATRWWRRRRRRRETRRNEEGTAEATISHLISSGRLAGLAWAASIGWVRRQKLMKRIEGRRKAPWRVTNDDPRERFFSRRRRGVSCQDMVWSKGWAGSNWTGHPVGTAPDARTSHIDHSTYSAVDWRRADEPDADVDAAAAAESND